MSDDPIINADGQNVLRFSEFLAGHRRGVVDHEVSLALHAVVGEVYALERKGSLTLRIDVTSDGDQQIAVAVDIVPKVPRAAAAQEHFFIDRMGNPTRQDPYQQHLESRDGHLVAVDPEQEKKL